MYNFDAKYETKEIIHWLRNMLLREDNNYTKAVIGVSGGKDSTVTLDLLCEAIGEENVIAVIIPNGNMEDFALAEEICHFFDVNYVVSNIENIYDSICNEPYIMQHKKRYVDELYITKESKINIAPRLRMTILYSIAQSISGRVIGTSNLSERYIGFFTKYGDGVSDLNPIGNYTCSEVIQIGQYRLLPSRFINKPPSDGLTGKTDEESFGFSYTILDEYIRTGICEDTDTKIKIIKRHINSQHKRELVPLCENDLIIHQAENNYYV